MPHAPWCTRNDRPGFWMRLRYGVLASQAMAKARPCAACERADLSFVPRVCTDCCLGKGERLPPLGRNG